MRVTRTAHLSILDLTVKSPRQFHAGYTGSRTQALLRCEAGTVPNNCLLAASNFTVEKLKGIYATPQALLILFVERNKHAAGE
jgi:hypothetical protein